MRNKINIIKYDVTYEGGLSGSRAYYSSSGKCTGCDVNYDMSDLEKVNVSKLFFFKKEVLLCKECHRDLKLKKLGVK